VLGRLSKRENPNIGVDKEKRASVAEPAQQKNESEKRGDGEKDYLVDGNNLAV